MRIACLGNVAANAYLLAKFCRRLGAEVDSFDLGGGNPMWLPWWEETDLDPRPVRAGFYDWVSVAEETGVKRPSWAKILGADIASPWYDTQEAYQADLARLLPTALTLVETGRHQDEYPEVRAALERSRLTPEEQERAVPVLADLAAWRSILALSRAYDLLVFCGPHASYACVLPAGVPYVTFEHSTMRLVPWLDQPEYHTLAAAYRHASANVITNADCGESAWCLGLDQCEFIPHPLDTDLFAPDECDEKEGEAAGIRERLQAGMPGGFDLLLFAPARQSRSARTGAKRNDRIFYAVRRYIDQAEPRGAPRVGLVAGAWGTAPDVQASARLIQQLDLADRTVWLTEQPKRRMAPLYRAADLVLDQFSEQVGSFGTCTAEAMACGKPVVTYIAPDAHAWCLEALGGSLPPVANARTADDIYEQLLRLGDRAHGEARRRALGAKARAWIERHHSWRVVAERHLDLYARVLGVSRDALVTLPPAERVEIPPQTGDGSIVDQAGELVAAG